MRKPLPCQLPKETMIFAVRLPILTLNGLRNGCYMLKQCRLPIYLQVKQKQHLIATSVCICRLQKKEYQKIICLWMHAVSTSSRKPSHITLPEEGMSFWLLNCSSEMPYPSATTVATSILLLNSPPFRVLVSSLLKILHSKLHSSCNKSKKP